MGKSQYAINYRYHYSRGYAKWTRLFKTTRRKKQRRINEWCAQIDSYFDSKKTFAYDIVHVNHFVGPKPFHLSYVDGYDFDVPWHKNVSYADELVTIIDTEKEDIDYVAHSRGALKQLYRRGKLGAFKTHRGRYSYKYEYMTDYDYHTEYDYKYDELYKNQRVWYNSAKDEYCRVHS